MIKRLPRKFYLAPTLTVAQELLGKYLIRKIDSKEIRAKIVETEAYIGPQDKASHTYGGKVTKRNKTVYLIGGHLYIYLCYGIHWQLNITTQKKGKPECVLIRALKPLKDFREEFSGSLDQDLANGPGKLTRWLELDKSFDSQDLVKSRRIWIAGEKHKSKFDKLKKSQITSTSRIGIDYAEEWAKKPWRFYISKSPFVSKKVSQN